MSILKKYKRLKKLKGRVDALMRDELLRVQRECQHPEEHVVEAPYEEDQFGGCRHSAPFAVCTLCGYSEQGWGCGYWKLKVNSDTPQITRDKGVRIRLTYYSQEDLNVLRFGSR